MLTSSQEMNALLAHGGKITAEATKDRGSARGAKTARNLLLDLHHPDILFGQIIIERHDELMHEPQDQGLIHAQAMQQIAHIISPQWTACAFFSRWWRIGCDPLLHQTQVACFVLLTHGPRQDSFALRTNQVDLRFDLQEQVFDILGPWLLIVLSDEGEFPEVMDIAERVNTGVLQIAGPAIMDADPLKLRQNPDRISGCFAPFLV